ncbi:hypothetical protein [Caproiciproducens galactitolivorans]|uniref:Uncharacterized protein n=1 Tax=Caproiciproducens galactitolivorans TaxID=642589 RepID=A0ABT4BR40_9FIRM|nr:hypothetical protein [Caproiciproducens galactitolivorans]MCY1713356.1 hypothetical protein [Caproiciproducens galactitolivorans]
MKPEMLLPRPILLFGEISAGTKRKRRIPFFMVFFSKMRSGPMFLQQNDGCLSKSMNKLFPNEKVCVNITLRDFAQFTILLL